MKIGYDAKRAFRNNSGLGNYSRMVIGGVARSGVGCVLYTPGVEGWHKDYFAGLPGLCVRQPRRLWRWASGVWRMVGAGLRAKGDGVEVFHGLSHELPYGIGSGVKKVVTMHDLIVRRYPQFFKPADRIIHRAKMRHACRVADVVVAISEQTRRDLMEMMGVPDEKIRVVYQSCDPIFWQWIDSTSKQEAIAAVREKYSLPGRYIICVGTFEERKNQQRVVQAWRSLTDDVGLVLVGRPRGSYGRAVAASGGEGIRVLDKADFRDFPALYAGAEASVYMSVFEGFGIPVIESLCCDTPVLTSNVSSMPEAGGDAALYASPDDVEAISRRLHELLTDTGLRRACIEKGRTQRMRFAPDKVTQDMLALYGSLLDD